MTSESYTFPNSEGHLLAARLDLPPLKKPRAYALFSHCFTCSKDLIAVRNISAALTEAGIAVFRFDFPGLGQSEGCFSETTVSTNVDDLFRAAQFIEGIAQGPQILIGHSLGGAAAIRAASLIDSVRVVATIGTPANPAHVTKLLSVHIDEINEQGAATVSLANRDFLIKKEFLADLESVSMEEATQHLGKALLIFHSPIDETVGIENAASIYGRALHPKSFISLDGADHLLTNPDDSRYVGQTIATWATRYLEPEPVEVDPDKVVVQIGKEGLRADILANGQNMIADEPLSAGGTNFGPTPYDYLTAGLGACTAMTLRLYADHKKWPLESVEVRLRHDKIHAADCEECETKSVKLDVIERHITLGGNLDDAQKARLLEIADRCPVHRTLESEIKMVTRLYGS
ncbi:MAG: uncharacterized OsmC-like protein/fermentation-respiration switch protein FrsA (DUF1100 family) [Verrucomicrobiales bacterium]|jgi:uncharacterized OsmC-like protein/fermentation-respiration switch protein FrsA (DUF1100 family)